MKNLLKIGLWLVIAALLISLFGVTQSTSAATFDADIPSEIDNGNIRFSAQSGNAPSADIVTSLAVILVAGALIFMIWSELFAKKMVHNRCG